MSYDRCSDTRGFAVLVDYEAQVRDFFDSIFPRAAAAGRDRPLVGGAFQVHDDPDAVLDIVRAYQAALFDAGYAWLTGPVSMGGAGRSSDEAGAFWRIASEYETPDTNALLVGLQIVVPAIAQFGTEEQRTTWLPRLLRAETIGCQLFSEPDAGSDLASLRTRAQRNGDNWIINGQKVWSSGAHHSTVGELLARTDPDHELRHRGLSMFLVDMDTPGITVRPLRQMNGTAHFCEVYFDNVRIPADRLIGNEGQGWAVAQVSLTSERDGFGDDASQLFIQLYDRLVGLAVDRGFTNDLNVRNDLAAAYSRDVITRHLGSTIAMSDPRVAGVGPSLSKLFNTRSDWQIAQIAARLLGVAAVADADDGAGAAWMDVILGVPAPRIAGGTDEIQKNIIAERGLGLPRDPTPSRQHTREGTSS